MTMGRGECTYLKSQPPGGKNANQAGSPASLSKASDLFEESIAWLKDNYDEFGFQVERDIVWTLQTYIVKGIKERDLPFRVFNDYPMLRGARRSLSADLVVIEGDAVEVAAEFKYEPSHRRPDIQLQKVTPSVVFWGAASSEAGMGVSHDVERARQFVDTGKAMAAYSIFIDEGGHFRHREPFPGSRWIDWESPAQEGRSVSILWARFPMKQS